MSSLEFILQSEETDFANALAIVLPPRTGFVSIRHRKLADAVQEVVAKCRKGGSIRTIYIVGHGSPEGQEFGSDSSDMITPASAESMAREVSLAARPGKARSLAPGKLDGVHLLRRLLPHYEKGGQLILGGCRVGSGDTAKMLSLTMPNVLVSSFDMAQVPTGMGDAGNQIYYMNGVVMRTELHKTLTSVFAIPHTFMQWTGSWQPN